MKRWLPILLTVVLLAWFASRLRAPREEGFRYSEFGRIPAVANGRLQPLDSLARNSLLQIREKQTANLEPWKDWNEKPRILPAIEWLAAVVFKPEEADAWPIFRVDHPDLVSMLKLPTKDKAKQCDGKHYSWKQIEPALGEMDTQSKRIQMRENPREKDQPKTDVSQRTPFEQAVMKMHERLVLYMRLRNFLQPQDAKDFAAELAEYEKIAAPGVAAVRAKETGADYDKELYARFVSLAERYVVMARFEPPLVLPPARAEAASAEWQRTGDALVEIMHGKPTHPALRHFAGMAVARRNGNAAAFNESVAAHHTALAPHAAALKKAGWEQFFNRAGFFYHAMVFYVLAFLLACFFWFNLAEWLRKSAFWIIAAAFVIHTAGLVFRMVLEGRPPVTNLYSSAIFIGWGAVGLGLVLERFFRDAIGLVVAASVGFVTLVIAHNLSLGGDTMEMMRAVLDTNFWLATHVVIVTLGYASTFVAGFLAVVYLLRGVFTRTLDATTAKSLSRMVYGIVCFATLFSFVGTVLGGIWADQSWGRFWGWDPKENGALIIVLWNALILHARWGGLVRERGLMNMALIGNIVTSWSWFGVNMLGIGLHSYGFMDAAFKWLMLFVGSQLLLIALGLLPQEWWRSFREKTPTPAPPAPAA